jgi:hypothetical protein
MLQPVYDNNYVVPKLIEAGAQPRWQPWTVDLAASPWKPSSDYKSFKADGLGAGPVWLRYQNILPSAAIWDQVEQGHRVTSPQPTLISDDYAYNDGRTDPPEPRRARAHWVGDLAVDCQLVVKEAKGNVILELVKGGRQFRCNIDLTSGKAALSIDHLPAFAPQASTTVHGPGTYNLSFSNVDEQLLLWMDGKVVSFNAPTTYEPLHNEAPEDQKLPTRGTDEANDLSPVGIGAQGGAVIEVRDLKVWRDIYYTADSDLEMPSFVESQDLSRPIDLQENEFFMMGDNSPASSDSRYWGVEHKVNRRLLIGKALFIYWPHSWAPSWAATLRAFGVELKLPFWPNFKRMTFVH